MATTEPELTDRLTEQGLGGDVVGGAVIGVVGLVHLFGLQVGGTAGFLLLLVVWPLVGGVVAARVERDRDGRDWGTTSAVSGTFAALVVTAFVFLAGLVGVWSGFITTAFGVTFWPVVFTVLVVFTITWTVFGYAGGFLENLVADGRASAESEPESEAHTETEMESDADVEAGSEPEPEADTEPEAEAGTEPEPEADIEPEPEAGTEPEPEADTEADDGSVDEDDDGAGT